MPILDKPLLVVSALAYLVLVVLIGLWALRRTRSSKDFFIAGQRIGLVVTGLATMSAAFSGFVFLGGPGLTYKMGISSLFIVVPVGFTSGLLCWVLGKRLRLLSEVREVYTIPDAIACRYGSRAASGLAAIAVALGTVGYLGAQFLAMGRVIQRLFDVEQLALAMVLGLLVVLIYSTAGGMMAGVYTDLFQGTLMVGAAVAVFLQATRVAGGWTELTRSIAGSEAFGVSFLDPLGTTTVYTAFGFFFVFGIGVLGQPHMLHKFYMLDEPAKLRWMPLVIGSTQTLCVLIWLGLGLAVPALVAQGRLAPLEQPDEAAPLFLLEFAPEILAGLVFAAVLAAIMSTADSFVNIGSAALVRDLPKAFGKTVRNELLWGRVATLGIAALAAIFAFAYGDLIALVGTFAFGTFAAGLAPALAIGLNWKRVSAAAAIASITTGTGLNLVLEFLAKQTYFPGLPKLPFAPGVLPAAVSIAVSFCVLFLVTWWTSRDGQELSPEVAAVMEA